MYPTQVAVGVPTLNVAIKPQPMVPIAHPMMAGGANGAGFGSRVVKPLRGGGGVADGAMAGQYATGGGVVPTFAGLQAQQQQQQGVGSGGGERRGWFGRA